MNAWMINAQICDEVFNFITDGEFVIEATGTMAAYIFGKPQEPSEQVKITASEYISETMV